MGSHPIKGLKTPILTSVRKQPVAFPPLVSPSLPAGAVLKLGCDYSIKYNFSSAQTPATVLHARVTMTSEVVGPYHTTSPTAAQERKAVATEACHGTGGRGKEADKGGGDRGGRGRAHGQGRERAPLFCQPQLGSCGRKAGGAGAPS